MALAVWQEAGSNRSAAQPKDGDPAKKWKYLGSSTCLQCHTEGPSGGSDDDFVLLTEYATWRTQDRHSLAYFALLGPRGQQMGKLLKMDVTKRETGCLNCHAMGFVEEKAQGGRFDIRDGVSCDACHGPAGEWLVPHQEPRTWRALSAAQKAELGMTDLRDPGTRARVCLDCHVGNVERGMVVTHAMYAAGHPPLPNVELAVLSRNLPQHWRDKRDVPFLRNPDKPKLKIDPARIEQVYHMAAADYQQSQLVMASSLVGLRGMMQLVAGRASLQAGDRDRRWPEVLMPFEDFKDREPATLWPQLAMAQLDCYACHHELQRSSWRQLRGSVGLPGRPPLRPWPMALVKQGIGVDAKDAPELSKGLAELSRACDARPFGDPARVARAADRLREWCQGRIDLANLQATQPDRLQMLRQLCALPAGEYPDYDSARQIVAAIQTVWNEWAPKGEKNAQASKLLTELASQFRLQPDTGRDARIELFRRQFNEMTGVTGDKEFLRTPEAVAALKRISDQGLNQLYPPKTKDRKQQEIGEAVRSFLAVVKRDGGLKLTDFLLGDTDEARKNQEKFLADLNQLNERELSEAMKQLAEYDPLLFKKRLEALAKLLPAN
jgi:hypothetical protein